MKKYVITESDLLNIFAEIYFLDSELFKLGTKLGTNDATQEEIRDEVYIFFKSHEVPKRLEKIRDLMTKNIQPDFFTEKQKNNAFFTFYEKWLEIEGHIQKIK